MENETVSMFMLLFLATPFNLPANFFCQMQVKVITTQIVRSYKLTEKRLCFN